MSTLAITDLKVSIETDQGTKHILKGVDLPGQMVETFLASYLTWLIDTYLEQSEVMIVGRAGRAQKRCTRKLHRNLEAEITHIERNRAFNISDIQHRMIQALDRGHLD